MGRASRRKREPSTPPQWSSVEIGSQGHGFCERGLVHHYEEIAEWQFWFCGHAEETKLTVGAPPWATARDLEEAASTPELGSVTTGIGAEAAATEPHDQSAATQHTDRVAGRNNYQAAIVRALRLTIITIRPSIRRGPDCVLHNGSGREATMGGRLRA